MHPLPGLLALFFCCLPALAAPTPYPPIRVAVTVDDLPTHGPLPPGATRLSVAERMLEALKRHHVPEVYGFVNGIKVEQDRFSYEVLTRWRDAGYPLGNHTYRHPDLATSTADSFTADIARNEPLLQGLAGKSDFKVFRYPFLREGDTLEKRNAVRQYLRDHHYRVAQVTIDFEDWSWNAPYARCAKMMDRGGIDWLKKTYLQNATDMLERADRLGRALFKRSIPHILLLHIGAFDAEMADELLRAYQKRGVKFIPLSEALRDPIYALTPSQDPGQVGRYGSELTFQVLKHRGLKLEDVGMKPYADYPEKKLEFTCK